eukprot:gene13011-biopygen8030
MQDCLQCWHHSLFTWCAHLLSSCGNSDVAPSMSLLLWNVLARQLGQHMRDCSSSPADGQAVDAYLSSSAVSSMLATDLGLAVCISPYHVPRLTDVCEAPCNAACAHCWPPAGELSSPAMHPEDSGFTLYPHHASTVNNCIGLAK